MNSFLEAATPVVFGLLGLWVAGLALMLAYCLTGAVFLLARKIRRCIREED